MRDAMKQRRAELRHEPTEKRILVVHGDHVVADTTRAVLVWEPRRVVPSYAVPAADLRAELIPAAAADPSDKEILHPGISFAAHSASGEAFDIRVGGDVRRQAAFRLDDRDLADHVVLDFQAFDDWYEESERVVSHPRDPFHRVDVRQSERHVRVELDGELLAESARPMLLFETSLPTRFYLPVEDVAGTRLASERLTYCAYKGEASYWSFGDHKDVAWTYRDPLPDAVQIKGRIAFFDELVDVIVDGARRRRPDDGIAKSIVDEARS